MEAIHQNIKNINGLVVQKFSPGTLENYFAFPKSLTAGSQNRTRCGRRRMSGALLIPMLLKGGCGYEDDES
jgi:hypothetical protein